MKTRMFFFFSSIGLLASCAKEQAIQNESVLPAGPETPSGVTTLTVGLTEAEELAPQNTRTHMDLVLMDGKHKVYWSNGDQIAANGVSSAALSEIPEYSQTAEFTFEGVLSTPYNIVYPASIYTDATHVALPAIQDYREGGFAEGMYPMAGCSADGQGITLGYLGALVKVSILRASAAADEDDLVAVRFKGRNNEQVSGVFTIDYENATLTSTSSATADKEVRVVKTMTTSTSVACVYYVVVPAGTYSNGFDIIVQDSKGHIMTQSKTVSQTLAAGHLYAMPEFEFVPTATEIGIEISSAQQLIQFATDYNNEVYVPLGDALVATLKSNITFDATTSASFNATGGIASVSEDNYFHGVFNGDGHTISGLSATVPLFAAIGSSGVAKDFTIDNTCSFTFTHNNAEECHFGPVVGYHKGYLKDVNVAANVSLAEVEDVAGETCLGGVAGRVTVGTIDNCDFSAAITVPAGFSSNDKKIQIGGIVGRISNGEGKVFSADFTGTIENQGQMIASSEADDLKNNPYLMIGGIAGLNTGTINDCTVSNNATGITVTLTDTSDHDYTGTIVTHSENAYHYALAGIAGRNDGTVSGCTNDATILNIHVGERGDGGNLNGRYLNVGGVVGFNKGSVSGSTNNGAIIDRAIPKIHYVGGVVGRNQGAISSCSNSTTAAIGVGTAHIAPYGARMLYLGGIAGSSEKGSSLSDVQNAAAFTVSRYENTTSIIVAIGGIVGISTIAIDGSTGTISNSGSISQSSACGMCDTPTDQNDYGLFLGGIAGYSKAGIKNVSNSGAISYECKATGIGAQYVHLGGVVGKLNAASTVNAEHCTNTANVTFTATAKYSEKNATRYFYNYLGGIAGYAKNVAIKGDASAKCTNSGVIKGGDGSANNNQDTPSFNVGGIVGHIVGASSVDYCELSGKGQAYNDHWSNRGNGAYDCPMNGGIAGQVVGTEEQSISITNCSVTSTNDNPVFSRRGAVGGIVGMAQYATISHCTAGCAFGGSGFYYGGIVAQAQNVTISDCSYSGTAIQSSQIRLGGGIVGYLDTGSLVDGCSSYATTINKNGTAITAYGGIAGQSFKVTEAVPVGETIQNCHYTAAIAKICSDTNFINGGGNVADL